MAGGLCSGKWKSRDSGSISSRLDLETWPGVPSRIIYDCASEFVSEIIQETAHLMKIQHQEDTLKPEHFNRMLKHVLSKQAKRHTLYYL